MEAKQANFYHMISENEAKIEKIASPLENQKKQMEKIERTTIRTLEHAIHKVLRPGLTNSHDKWKPGIPISRLPYGLSQLSSVHVCSLVSSNREATLLLKMCCSPLL
jgi:hypothetical protein